MAARKTSKYQEYRLYARSDQRPPQLAASFIFTPIPIGWRSMPRKRSNRRAPAAYLPRAFRRRCWSTIAAPIRRTARAAGTIGKRAP